MSKKRKAVWVGDTPVTPISTKERRTTNKRVCGDQRGLRRWSLHLRGARAKNGLFG